MSGAEELKDKVRFAKVTTALAVLVLAPNAKLSAGEDLKSSSHAAHILLQNHKTYLDYQDMTAKSMQEQLSKPVMDENRINDEGICIGPFTEESFLISEENKRYEPTQNYARPPIERPIVLEPSNRVDVANASMDRIEFPKYVLSEDYINSLSDEQKSSLQYLIKSGNPLGEVPTYYHELTHYEHFNNGQMEHGTGQTNLALSYTTEKVAHSVQYLSVAYMYKTMKDKGIENIHHNGENIPLDKLVDFYPGLKEIITKPDFNLDNKDCVIDVVKKASDYFDNTRFDKYCTEQFVHNVSGYNLSIVELINSVKDGQLSMDEMLRNRNIGQGVRIDIPKECAKYLQPSQDFLDKFVALHNDNMPLSNKGLLALDNYLESINLKSDAEKNEYLKKQFTNIINRTDDADLTLRDLMVNCSLKKDDQIIYYADGLLVENNNGTKTVSNDLGKTRYPMTFYFEEYLDKAQKTQTSSHQQENNNNGISALQLRNMASSR